MAEDSGATGHVSGRQMVGRGSIYVAGAASQLVAAALVVPIITRSMEPTQYGLVALALALHVVYAALCGFGLATPLTLVYFQRDDGRQQARQLVASTALIAGLVAVALAVVGILVDRLIDISAFFPLFALLPLLAAPEAVNHSVFALLRADNRPKAFICLSLFRAAGSQVFGLAALGLTEPTAAAYMFGYGAAVLLTACVGLVASGSLRAGLAAMPIVRYGIDKGARTLPHLVSLLALGTGDRLLLGALGDTVVVARYQVAYIIGALPVTLLVATNNAWMATIFGAKDDARRWRVLARSTCVLLAAGGFAVAGYALITPIGIRLLAPPSYDLGGLAAVSMLIVLSTLPYAVFLAAAHIINWHGRTGVLGWVTPVAVACNFVLVVVLYPITGLIGAGLATLLAIGLQGTLAMRQSNRLLRLTFEPGEIRSAALGLVVALVATAVSIGLPETDLFLAARMIVAFALFVVAAAILIERAGLRVARRLPRPLRMVGRRLAPGTFSELRPDD